MLLKFEEQIAGTVQMINSNEKNLMNDHKNAWRCKCDVEKVTQQIGDQFASNKDLLIFSIYDFLRRSRKKNKYTV